MSSHHSILIIIRRALGFQCYGNTKQFHNEKYNYDLKKFRTLYPKKVILFLHFIKEYI